MRVQATQERSKERSRGNSRERSQERLRGKVSKENKRGIAREILGKTETIKKMAAAEREYQEYTSGSWTLYLNNCTLFSIFDTYVCRILNYGCEVLGFPHRTRY